MAKHIRPIPFRAPYDLGQNFWDPSEGLYGVYDLWSFKGSGSVVSSGVGGGSLIYANVLIRKDADWFKEDQPDGGYEPWPVTYKDLERHYERVEHMMNAQKYPLNHPPYGSTYKTLAMQEADRTLQLDDQSTHRWMPLNLAVSFRSDPVSDPDHDDPANPPVVGGPIHEAYANYHSVTLGRHMPRSTCRLCGECDLGCNYGSKNTLDYTYLTAAIHQQSYPAQIETLCEVKAIAPCNGRGYTVEFVRHDLRRAGTKCGTGTLPRERMTCDRLILSAGTYGTPFLLFRNRAAFPQLSPRLGSRFCVNGDLLGFILKSMERKNGQSVPRRLDPSFGPVITSAIRLGDTLDGQGDQGRGMYVEDGGNPYLFSWVMELSGLTGYLRRTLKFLQLIAKYRLGLHNDANLSAEVADLLGPARHLISSLPMLPMGRDLPNGKLFLRDGFLDCDWTMKKSQEYYDRVRRVGKAIARALQAEYLDNPSYTWNFHQVVTAHPLGGCPMALRKEEGVVDSYGEVFDYPAFYIADGSVLPGPVGPNPSLTIAALSDRFADHIIAQHTGAINKGT